MATNGNGRQSGGEAIMFGFPDPHSGSLAFAMLEELGYAPVRHGSGEVHVHLEPGDLTSALEIAMAYGGHPLDRQGFREDALFCSAYDMDAIPIPAHLVAADESDAREEGPAPAIPGAQDLRYRDDDDTPTEDDYLPGHGDYDHFSGDVRA